jgi:hypothetical protein
VHAPQVPREHALKAHRPSVQEGGARAGGHHAAVPDATLKISSIIPATRVTAPPSLRRTRSVRRASGGRNRSAPTAPAPQSGGARSGWLASNSREHATDQESRGESRRFEQNARM